MLQAFIVQGEAMSAVLFTFWAGLFTGIGLVFNTAKACEYFQMHEDSGYRTQFYGFAYGFVSLVGIGLCLLPWFFVVDTSRPSHIWFLVGILLFALFVPFIIGSIPSARRKVNEIRENMKDRF